MQRAALRSASARWQRRSARRTRSCVADTGARRADINSRAFATWNSTSPTGSLPSCAGGDSNSCVSVRFPGTLGASCAGRDSAWTSVSLPGTRGRSLPIADSAGRPGLRRSKSSSRTLLPTRRLRRYVSCRPTIRRGMAGCPVQRPRRIAGSCFAAIHACVIGSSIPKLRQRRNHATQLGYRIPERAQARRWRSSHATMTGSRRDEQPLRRRTSN